MSAVAVDTSPLAAALSALRSRLDGETAPLEEPPALARIGDAFGLSSFERELLLLCAAGELDSAFPQVTFSLAFAALTDAHWSALAPTGPLRRWRLVEIDTGNPLASARLRIDERVLHELVGVTHLDERLLGLVDPLLLADDLAPSRRELVDRLAALWASSRESWTAVQLCGTDAEAAREVTAAAATRQGLVAFVVRVAEIPAAPSERDALARLWEREAALVGALLLVERDDDDPREAARAATRFVESTGAPLVVAGREPLALRGRSWARVTVPPLDTNERTALWRATLGSSAVEHDGEVDAVAAQFALSAEAVRAAAADALGRGALWEAAREQARPRLDELAPRIEPRALWDDLVLPESQTRTLREIVLHVRNRASVYQAWGFAAKSARGLGISALFAGPSGTGKTMAAEVLANELRLDLYRIDLSAVVSKYIGETEKNLRRVFDAAESGGVILLFDEADALFGKRSEVKDSHDRYANIEIGYLLQRMEAYRGLAILTTNMRGALDSAFLRRLRFVVQFPFPDAARRGEIWRRVFPAETPTADLDLSRLARLDVPGGAIRNIALNAAFLAADADEPVRMAHLASAARSEVAKLERPLTEAEIGDWK
jgi:ATPase family associated with various cellular activities (AAA)